MRFLQVLAAVAVCLLAAFVFLQPIFSNMGNLGLYDWDQHFFYQESARVSLAAFGEFPLWTPYYCGGNIVLANPQSSFLSPFFLFVMAFGPVIGLKLEALVFLAVGLLGTFLAARKLGCRAFPSVFAAVVFLFSSWFPARVLVGHTTFFPFALLPVVFLSYLGFSDVKASFASRVRWAVFCALALAVMFFSGGIYPFYAAVLLLLLFAFFDFVSLRKVSPVALVFAVLLLAALLSSVKLVPVIDFTQGVESEKDVQLTSANIVLKSLFWRDQSIPENDLESGRDLVAEGRQKELDTLAGRLPWGWHEYSAYVGVIPVILAAFAALLAFRANWKLVMAALFFLLLALGSYIPGPWVLIRQLPFFSSLHGPSRFMIVFVFLIALLAARAMTSIKLPNEQLKSRLIVGLCIIVALDLFLVSRGALLPEMSGQRAAAFPIEPFEVKSTLLGTTDFIQMASSAPHLAQYTNLRQGIGTLNCYERLHLRTRAVPQFIDGEPYAGFVANAFIAETNESFNFTHFSPHRVSLRLPNALEGFENGTRTLVINQNYYKDWRFDGFLRDAGSYRGRLAALITLDDLGKEVTFSYFSKSFLTGAIISVVSFAAAILLLMRPSLVKPLSGITKRLESYVFRQS
ncbi:hypothetical protein HYU18_00850 [Candidatus Woesearchaeota archaeon]|nr:hypothetical protein [Candidatus Woesearchaeota archaeon]